MTPTTDHVFIEVEEPSKQTASGIYLVKSWDNLPPVGIVKSVGPDVRVIKEGDRVVFMQYASVELPEQNIRVVKEGHILGVMNDTDTGQ